MPDAISSVTVDGPAAVIGDVHGRSDVLASLLKLLPASIPVFVLGDLCDRGPDTRGVIEQLVARGARGVTGNHERWLTRWVTGRGFDTFALSRAMGGEATLRSYGVTSRVPADIARLWEVVPEHHREWLASLPVAMDLHVGGHPYWLVHAGLPLHRDLRGRSPESIVPWLAAEHPDDVLWPANHPELVLPVDRPVIMGHMPRRRPYDGGHVIAVDTGCGTLPDGRLTAVILPERRFLTVG